MLRDVFFVLLPPERGQCGLLPSRTRFGKFKVGENSFLGENVNFLGDAKDFFGDIMDLALGNESKVTFFLGVVGKFRKGDRWRLFFDCGNCSFSLSMLKKSVMVNLELNCTSHFSADPVTSSRDEDSSSSP